VPVIIFDEINQTRLRDLLDVRESHGFVSILFRFHQLIPINLFRAEKNRKLLLPLVTG